MSDRKPGSSFELSAHGRTESRPVRRDRGEPLRMLLLGDFTGRESRGVKEPLLGRKPRRVDRDNLDTFAGLRPELGGGTLTDADGRPLVFTSLDDLHPDFLWRNAGAFARFRQMRARLLDPEQFASAAAELGGAGAAPSPPAAPEASRSPRSEGDSGGSPGGGPGGVLGGGLLDAAIAETSAQAQTGSEFVDALLRELVVDRVPATPGQEELVGHLDRTATEAMGRSLRSAEYRRLEALWRGVEFLVRRLDTDSSLELWLFDVSRPELVADLVAHEEVPTGELWRTLFQPDAGADAPRWGVWSPLDLAFGASAAQLALLSRVNRLAAEAAVPCVAGAVEDLAGCSRAADLSDPVEWGSPGPEVVGIWSGLRARPEAAWTSLVLPRLLLRAPYGRRTSPVQSFAFEELGEPAEHEQFVWGNGALAACCVLGREFNESGWEWSPLGSWELDRMPTPVYRDESGDEELKPGGEALLPESAVAALRELGLVPLVTVRGTDRLRLGPLTSLTGAPLAGGWA